MYCYIDDVRQICQFSLNPLAVTIQSSGNSAAPTLYSGQQIEVKITTRYEYPNGIKLPAVAGQYNVKVEVHDEFGA